MTNRVFVTGVGMVTPLGLDTASTWNSLIQGISGVDHISAFDTEGFETRFAAEVKGFDPAEYIDKKKARHLDRFAQFAMVAVQEALWQAELDLAKMDPTRAAAIVGSGIGGITTLSEQFQVLKERGATRVSPFLIPMMLADMASGQVSMAFGIKGPNFCTVSSCSSGAEAIGEAWNMIRRGDVDVAVAGGAEAPICPVAVAGFNACQALSRRNDDPKHASRPFDADRDGFVMGEGAGILVLESLESVRRRDANVLAELVGYGASSDAFHVTQPAPEGEGAARAMRLSLKAAGLSPQDISYINAHGTSTPLNDKFETMALKSVFGQHAYRIPISSTKSMTGHLLGAGAAVEAAISVVALQKGIAPPTINLERPDPECDLDYTPNVARQVQLRAVMSNAFGFGGHNSSLIFRTVSDLG
ncbi:MAG: beta-ketoacyl-ACP synthase II [Dehalococcoidia bacterium]|nr:beta-ketoacyl-ACP synthase II [Dehalococcoidia bacterium]